MIAENKLGDSVIAVGSNASLDNSGSSSVVLATTNARSTRGRNWSRTELYRISSGRSVLRRASVVGLVVLPLWVFPKDIDVIVALKNHDENKFPKIVISEQAQL